MTNDSSAAAIAGIDHDAVTRWFAEHVDGARPPFRFRLIAGGRSNLTFRVDDDAGTVYVLRRPPLGTTLASAHDMGREARILSALRDSPVPVPAVLGFCDDPAVNGATFYVMEFVPGPILRDRPTIEAAYTPQQRTRVGDSLLDGMAQLHALDPDAVGLGELGRKEGYVERQLRRWHRQFEESKSRDIPAVERAHDLLAAAVPPQLRPAIVHGDYRLDNVIFDPAGSLIAVLDWELCTLGDQLADVGMLLTVWVQDGEDITHMKGRDATAADGMPTRADLVAGYAQRTGLDLSGIDFYVALAHWKLACIGEGVYSRYKAGAMGDEEDVSIEALAAHVQYMAGRALEIAERLG